MESIQENNIADPWCGDLEDNWKKSQQKAEEIQQEREKVRLEHLAMIEGIRRDQELKNFEVQMILQKSGIEKIWSDLDKEDIGALERRTNRRLEEARKKLRYWQEEVAMEEKLQRILQEDIVPTVWNVTGNEE